MIYLEAPNKIDFLGSLTAEDTFYQNAVFLAGSITGAWNWQDIVKKGLIDKFNIVNPRRADFDVTRKGEEEIQITWEHGELAKCRTVLFWFSKETLAPITLFELGTLMDAALFRKKNVFVGIDPEYKRKNDVIIQSRLRCPQIEKNITFSLIDLMQKVRESVPIWP